MPTYNFAVVVDDWDLCISHVFRGDEHQQPPWQINLFQTLGAPLPRYGHLYIILGDDGQLSSDVAHQCHRVRRRGLPKPCSTTSLDWAGVGDDDCQYVSRWFLGLMVPTSQGPCAMGPRQVGVGERPALEGPDNTRLAGLMTLRLVNAA